MNDQLVRQAILIAGDDGSSSFSYAYPVGTAGRTTVEMDTPPH